MSFIPLLSRLRTPKTITADGGFHLTMIAAFLGSLVISAIGYAFCDISVAWKQAIPLALTLLLLSGMAAQYKWRKETRCFNITMMALWIVVVTNAHFFPMYMAARRVVPLCDATLAGFDRWLGLEVPTVLAVMKNYPLLNSWMLAIYGTLIPLMTLATVLPPILNRMETAKEFLLSCLVAATISLPIFAFVQAVGPWDFYGFQPAIPSLSLKAGMLQTLDSAQVFMVDLSNRDGLITFPSFHVILTVLAAASLRSYRRLRWIVMPWAALIVMSTVTTGIHYSIDVIGGLGIATFSWWCATRYLKWLDRLENRVEKAPAV